MLALMLRIYKVREERGEYSQLLERQQLVAM
jgi:hypothetical protein